MIKIKRLYEPKDKADGYRILVDRLWPRGVSKDKKVFDTWLKEVAPSNELRTWFSHNDDKWMEFRMRYSNELKWASKKALLRRLKDIEREKGTVTLVYSARDEEHNNAVALRDVLRRIRSQSIRTELTP